MTSTTMDPVLDLAESRMAAIEAKLDALAVNVQMLGDQIQVLADKAHEDRRRQQEWEEFRTDITPIVGEMYDLTVQQLEEIQAYVQLEDVLAFLKRLARNVNTFDDMLDQVESMRDLWKELGPLTNDMFAQAVTLLSELEQKGYFGFARQSRYVADQVVTSFDENDVRMLGDNIVLILNTVKALTQPEMMNLLNNLTQGFHEAEMQVDDLPTSMWGLLREMRDPEVRRGLAITLTMLKRVSQQQYPSNGISPDSPAHHQ